MVQVTGSLVQYPARASFIWYAGFITWGALMLWLPMSGVPGKDPISFLDALFTATSASCVTGLSVRSTPHDFSFFGQAMILVLIQLGGIGIMTVTTFIVFQMGARGSLRQRALISATLGAESNSDLKSILRRVLAVTIVIEGIGFLLLAIRNAFDKTLSWQEGLWQALFHSVSAFCNAGFALYDDSLVRYQTDPVVNVVICALIMLGGIGFPVLLDVRKNWNAPSWIDLWDHLQLHSKVMLLGSVVLWLFGMVTFILIEWDGAMDEVPWYYWPMIGMFHSVTCRTAGYNTIDMRALSNATLFIAILLMAIGAGPCSTAGGFKVSTAVTLVLRAWATFRGHTHVNVFRRTIPHDAIEKATATAMLFIVVGTAALTLLLLVEQAGPRPELSSVPAEDEYEEAKEEIAVAKAEGESPTGERARSEALPVRAFTTSFIDASFEVTSALGTVGLSTGMTPLLSDPGRIIIILCMFFGRLGPISVFAALSREERVDPVEHPAEEPLLG